MGAKKALLVLSAKAWRILLCRTTFVGITGSCGKTTTARLTAAVLDRHGHTTLNSGAFNMTHHVCRAIWKVKPRHYYCVQELSGAIPGILSKSIDIVRPKIGIVTHIGLDHYKNFRSPEAIAEEKSTLIKRLPSNGTAILNIDDPLVRAMSEKSAASIVTYGLDPDADVQATNITAGWPDRLNFDITWRDATATVKTRLLPAHQIHSVLAAIATGLSIGLPLTECTDAISKVEPQYGRMWPIKLSNGTVFIVDCWKAPHWTMNAILDYMAISRAKRKILVIGSLSDIQGSTGKKYRKIAQRALETSDITLFVGPNAKAVRELSRQSPNRLIHFEKIADVREWLCLHTLPGDLVLLKGTIIDHLERLFLDHRGKVECWIDLCKLIKHCKDCNLVGDIQVPNKTARQY